ncbi:cytochrome P450 [Chytriomyces sp. MP71]|nr:cytochrome P450 [Chytriomyces sp. MP71]
MLFHTLVRRVKDAVEGAAQLLHTTPENLGIAALSAFAAAVAYSVITRKKRKGRSIPGPKGYPIFGSLFDFAAYGNRGKTADYFTALHEAHGDTVAINLMGRTLVLSRDLILTHKALTDPTSFRKTDFGAQRTKGITDNALFVMEDGEVWRHHRKFLQPAFGPQHLRHMGTVAREDAGTLCEGWVSKAKHGSGAVVVDVFHEFTALTLDIIGTVAFSYNFQASNNYHHGREADGQQILQDIAKQLQERFANPPFLWRLVGVSNASPRLLKTRQYVDGLLNKVIASKRADVAAAGKDWKAKDVLDRLLSLDEKGKPVFTEAEIIGEVMAFFFAGHETTANTLTFIALELSRNPAIQFKLKNEIKTLVAKLTTPIMIENLADLKYLDNVVKEAQRRHSVVGALGRSPITTVEHDGHILTPDMRVMMNIRAIHMDPRYWKNPEAFDPDRWDGPVVPHAFLPFGDGPRNCIGQKMAVIEAKMVMVEILKRFTLEFVEQELDFVSYATYGLKKGLQIRMKLDA